MSDFETDFENSEKDYLEVIPYQYEPVVQTGTGKLIFKLTCHTSAVNVAYGKPSNQSSTTRGGDANHANDGDLSTVHENRYCTQTRKENSPWWMVDLLQPYEIRNVRILTRGCCGQDHLQDIEIRVGNSSSVQSNRLCAWYPGRLDDGVTKDFSCARPINGRFVFIQMVGIEGTLSLCEVSVFTTQEFSPDMCGGSSESNSMVTFNETCFEFQVSKGGTLEQAERYCQERKGHVVNNFNYVKNNFITAELNRLKSTIKTQLLWIGAKRQPGIVSRKWSWLDGNEVKLFMWGENQPNNYNGEQNCVVLDGGRRWKWNDVSCNLDYLPWICQYSPLSCGSPDKKLNSTFVGTDFALGKTISYECPVGNVLHGGKSRRCSDTGVWNGVAPSCQFYNKIYSHTSTYGIFVDIDNVNNSKAQNMEYLTNIDCGPLPSIKKGKGELEDDRTTYNATAVYICDENHILVGETNRKCGKDGKWKGETPQCLYNLCKNLSDITNGSVSISSLQSDGKAQYSCDEGNKLYGNEIRQCKLGGEWTGKEPRCKYIDCGEPKDMPHGRFNLVEATTYYTSHVLYTCAENHTLDGPEQRTCLETGKWSGHEPSCNLINCGEPEQPPGSYITGNSFVIYSNVKYECEPGHLMRGDDIRQCGKDGRWTGQAPSCQYIDCGRISPIPRGELFYVNETTHLGSVLTYKCIKGYKLSHLSVRKCKQTGRWSNSTPKCLEIRCNVPDSPANSTLSYENNDRPAGDSFKIGSTVQYKCMKGYSVQGKSLRTCESSGQWNGLAPYCNYVDCGYPEPIFQGFLKLATNTTYYGSTVEYGCIPNYKLVGPPRRLCLENGEWSHRVPSCEEIKCSAPDSVEFILPISGVLFSVGDVVIYRCQKGYRLEGNSTRQCDRKGKWTKNIPSCEIVDCGSPTLINNGKGYLVNGTMTYGSLVDYECLPGFQLVGDDSRKCLDTGAWSGLDPRCAVFGDQNDGSDGSYARNVGIGVGISIGALLLVVIIVAVVCMRTRKEKPVKNTENIEATASVDKDPALVTAYNRIDPNSVPQRQGTTVAILTNNPQRDGPSLCK
ncbi:CUB and sushi domain-containing protein 2 [Nymphon striatum]|nr:CUB and sushi domain-containing protein 2 [Nymphon striatum]